jgi:cytidylate kinase
MNRSASPLRQPSDAHLIDTSKMDIEAAFLEAKKLIDAALRS